MKPILLNGNVGLDAQTDIDHTYALMREMQGSSLPLPILRVYQPRPTVAFSRRESLMPSFAAAEMAARDHGFASVIRLAGGRAVAYDKTCLVIDLITPTDRRIANDLVFDVAAECVRMVLMDLGVDARVGPVPREYCAGAHSVNARGVVKLVGIAQRVTRGARLVAASIALGPGLELSAVLSDVYAAMSLDWDPSTFGTLADEVTPAVLLAAAGDITNGLAETHTKWAETPV